MSRGAWFAEPLAQADGSRACEPNLNGAVSGAPSHLRDSIGRRRFPAASATFSPAATVSPRSIPRVSEFRGALAGGFGPRPFILGSAMRAVSLNFVVKRLKPGSLSLHDGSKSHHANQFGGIGEQGLTKGMQGRAHD